MNEFDDLENTLAAELRRRSGDVLGTEGMATRARRRARVVRRRRAIAVSAVTAVTLAIAVPTALSLRSVPQTAPQPADTPTTSETPTPDPTTPPSSPPADPSPPAETDEPEEPVVGGTTELVLDGMAEGAPPSISWVEGTTFHTEDGRTLPIPEDFFRPFAIRDGAIGQMPGTEGPIPDIATTDATGAVASRGPGNGPVLSYDGFLIAYYDPEEDHVWAGQADGGGTGPGSRDVAPDQRLDPAGFLDDYALVSNVSTDAELWAGIRIDSFAPGDPTPPVTPPWDFVRVVAVSQPAGLVAGYTEIRDDGTCSAVYEADADEPLWSTCEYSFDHFSPDGRYLVGTHDYRDGEGNMLAVVVDARTGEVVHTYDGRFISDATFEDDEHVLISVRLVDGAERQAALVRCDFEGSCEQASPVVRIDELDDGYHFGLQRW
ncbi:hypothetical protein E1262_14580 [Jiangella aurantiaca]|uniref:WD40 repeat domain-containing protein n=1 Tax=Jiangella aurantiaca TaxID=2530373 RepID=A0A4R5AA17_9ACTN|nr:hypothetical protein [Jiangella aurantiaca]TDD68961.1 hypothetical protein E1262_14580 [Jiangella aurantiaca]